MAATGKTPILLYGSTTPTNAPVAGNLTNSSDGCEIAINVADKNLFFKDSSNNVNTVPIRQSSASSNGWLSSTDWSTFNSKVSSQWTTSGSYIYYTGGVAIGGSSDPGSTNLTVAGSTTTKSATVTDFIKINNVVADQVGTYGVAYGTSGVGLSIAAYSMRFLVNSYDPSSSGYTSLTLTNGGDVYANAGNFVVGTSGKGIDFSATAGTGTSELLADYEEGTWTPVPVPAAGSITSYTSAGYYTKVGRQVTIQFTITITNVGTATALSSITGLPYANNYGAAAGCGREAGVTGSSWQYVINAGASTAYGLAYNNNAGIATNYILYGTITYFN